MPKYHWELQQETRDEIRCLAGDLKASIENGDDVETQLEWVEKMLDASDKAIEQAAKDEVEYQEVTPHGQQ